jgi:hypothetical protein
LAIFGGIEAKVESLLGPRLTVDIVYDVFDLVVVLLVIPVSCFPLWLVHWLLKGGRVIFSILIMVCLSLMVVEEIWAISSSVGIPSR